MKLLFSTLIAAAMAASVQAFTVAWSLQNSNWGADSSWTGQTATTGADLHVLVFFAAAEEGKGLDAAGAAAHVATGGGTTANYNAANYGGYNTTNGAPAQVHASNLNMNPANQAGYYYMVVFSGAKNDGSADTSTSYAVAKTAWIADSTNAKEHGVYNTASGTVPDKMDYVQLDWMLDSSWKAPLQTPEPTAMALLALGVAGLALRRKNA